MKHILKLMEATEAALLSASLDRQLCGAPSCTAAPPRHWSQRTASETPQKNRSILGGVGSFCAHTACLAGMTESGC